MRAPEGTVGVKKEKGILGIWKSRQTVNYVLSFISSIDFVEMVSQSAMRHTFVNKDHLLRVVAVSDQGNEMSMSEL